MAEGLKQLVRYWLSGKVDEEIRQCIQHGLKAGIEMPKEESGSGSGQEQESARVMRQ